VVKGEMPLDTAKALYEHPIGRTDIRVDGHCGCPPPEHPWLEYRDADGFKIIHDPEGKQERQFGELIREGHLPPDVTANYRFAPDAAAVAARVFVDCYHVDSELGLYLLAEAIRGLP
jgi:hypothetical protein